MQLDGICQYTDFKNKTPPLFQVGVDIGVVAGDGLIELRNYAEETCGSCAGGAGLHVASFLRAISRNCLMSVTSRGMIAVGMEMLLEESCVRCMFLGRR